MAKDRINHDPGITDEPHMKFGAGEVTHHRVDSDDITVEPARSTKPFASGYSPATEHLHALGDEPALSGEVSVDAHIMGYADYIAERSAVTNRWKRWGAVLLASAIAGPFAVFGSLVGSGQSWIAIVSLCLFGPLVEEMLKLAGALYLVEQRPWLLPGVWCVPVIAFFSALEFAIIENFVYLHIYVPNPSEELVAWRWTVCVMLHVVCSLIGGLGLARVARKAAQSHSRIRISSAAPCFITAIALHGLYNGFVYILTIFGMVF